MSSRQTVLDHMVGPLDEDAQAPSKVSGVRMSRIKDDMGCSYCFPHGRETRNASLKKRRRSWKFNRAHRWRERKQVP